MKKLSLSIVFVLCCIVSNANTIYVDHAAVNPGTGFTWATAYTLLEDAISASNSGDVIRVSQGTYTAPAGGYVMKDGVRILGGHPPAAPNPVPDFLRNAWRNVPNYPVRLVANFGVGMTNSVLTANSSLYAGTIIDGVIIGDINSDGLELNGFAYDLSARFVNCTFEVREYGLHIDNPLGKFAPSFTDCEFLSNSSQGNNNTAILIATTLGPLSYPRVEPNFTNCSFHDFDYGVALIASFGLYSPKFEKCEFYNILNHVFTNYGNLWNSGIGLLYGFNPQLGCPTSNEFLYTPTINNSIFYNNGGVINLTSYYHCTTTDVATKFNSCTFYNNPGFGWQSSFLLLNLLYAGTPPVVPDMVVMELENCVSYGNHYSGGTVIGIGTAMQVKMGHSMIEASSTASNGTNSDPLYGMLSPHPTIDQVIDLGGNIFAQNPQFVDVVSPTPNLDIMSNSPARNSGLTPLTTFPPPASPDTDFIGRIRVNETDIDMGAHEFCPLRSNCYPTTPLSSLRTASDNELSEQLSVDVYPNPFSDQLNISRSIDTPAIISIHDARGVMITTIAIDSKLTNINMSDYSRGVYTITVNDTFTRETIKVVKQ